MKRISLIFLFLLFVSSAFGQLNPQSVSIPLRDNKNLAGDLYLPNLVDTFPTILIMTPYGKSFFKITGLPFGVGKDITKSKYAILIVDWRCRFASMSACSPGSDNGVDGYDVVEWAASQSWSDGKIGTWGPSALGNVQFSTAKQKPPHLVCSVPEVSSPIFEYVKYHPGGSMEASTFKTLNEKLFPGSYNTVIKNPYYNLTWQFVEGNSTYPEDIEVPMLLIGGWYDHNIEQDIRLVDLLNEKSATAVRGKHKILIGPWVHGGSGQASLGTVNQGEYAFPNAAKWNDSISLVFFDYYLRGIQNNWEQNQTFTFYHIGTNQWQTSNAWPAETVTNQKYYLNKSNALTKAGPTESDLMMSYVYDPLDPSPTIGGKTLSDDLDQGPYDQSVLVEGRNDIVLFTSETLTEDFFIQGKTKIHLNVSSDRLDTDFVVRLTEVFPNGKSIQLNTMIQRMRFRGGNTKNDTVFMEDGTVYPIDIVLDDIAYTFKTGNKIRLAISSSNYPLYNRNMNNGELNMYPGDKVDSVFNPVIANNSIHFGMINYSYVEFPMIKDFTTSIKEQSGNESFLYPNPAKEVVFIHDLQEGVGYEIIDLQGKSIARGRYDSRKGVSINGISKGVYYVKVNHLGLFKTSKLIIE